jgi:hypothetical protein
MGQLKSGFTPNVSQTVWVKFTCTAVKIKLNTFYAGNVSKCMIITVSLFIRETAIQALELAPLFHNPKTW